MNSILRVQGRSIVAAIIITAFMWSTGYAHKTPVNVAEQVINIHGKEFKFSPDVIKLVKGQKVTIIFTNDGVLAHNFVIEALGVKTKTIQSGEAEKLVFTPQKVGIFKFRCLVPGHMEAGMKGKITVGAATE